jgi:hypothetical protein
MSLLYVLHVSILITTIASALTTDGQYKPLQYIKLQHADPNSWETNNCQEETNDIKL